MANKYHYDNSPLLQINLVEDGEYKYFQVFNFNAPYLGYQTDDLSDLLVYIDNELMERI